jgi:ankyrin repeat protein
MTSIFKVIRDNDVQLLNYLIDEDHSTFSKGDLKRVKHLDLNKRSVNGRTALHCAVTWNRVEMVQALMHCPSVNINLCDRENGWTALHR